MSSFDYQDSTITKYRAGTSDDPYIDITEDKKVINGQFLLNEIPVLLNKVRIDNMFEVPQTSSDPLRENEYRVDYSEGIVSFHPSAEGLTLTAKYKGRGNHYISASRVWTKESNGDVLETLEDILTAGEGAVGNIQELSKLMKETEIAKNDAITAADNANNAANATNTVIQEANETNDLLISNEDQREANETTRQTNEQERVNNEATRVQQETVRQTNENERKSNEDQRQANELVRQQQETKRQQDTATAISNAETATTNAQTVASNTKGVGAYSNTKRYSKNNFVTYNGSSYMALEDNLIGILPTDSTKWQLVAQRGVDGNGSVVSVNKISPDLNGNVELNPEELGAEATANKNKPNGYAGLDSSGYLNSSLIPNNIETTTGSQQKADAAKEAAMSYTDEKVGEITPASIGAETPTGAQAKADAAKLAANAYTDQQISLVTETGIPKLVSYPLKVTATTDNQTVFEIPLDLFDANTDTLLVAINRAVLDSTQYTVTNTIRDESGQVTQLGKITLLSGVTITSELTMVVLKNVPIGPDGAINGAVLAVDSVPINRVNGLQDQIQNITRWGAL